MEPERRKGSGSRERGLGSWSWSWRKSGVDSLAGRAGVWGVYSGVEVNVSVMMVCLSLAMWMWTKSEENDFVFQKQRIQEEYNIVLYCNDI